MRRFALVLVLALAALVLVVPAAGARPLAAEAVKGVYAGRVQGTHAYIALVAGKGGIVAYVCDSREIARWFGTHARKHTATLKGGDGSRVRVHFTDKAATGTVTLADGSEHRFRAPRATGTRGLWWATGETNAGAHYWAGWILLPGGRQRGNTVKVEESEFAAAGGSPIFDPGADFVVGPAPALDTDDPEVTVLGVTDTAKRLSFIDRNFPF